MGLLNDIFNSEDGRMGLGLLAAAGPRSVAQSGFGDRMQEAAGSVDAWKQNQLRQKMADMQMRQSEQEFGRKQKEWSLQDQERALAQQYFKAGTPGKPAVMGDANLPPELQTGAAAMPAIPGTDPSFDLKGFSSALMPIDYTKGIALMQAMQKDNTPITVAPGASLVDKHTFKPVFTAPKEMSTPSAIKEYNFAKDQGFGGTFQEFQLSLKKAGASVNNNTVHVAGAENKYNADIGAGLAKDSLALIDTAKAAPEVVTNARLVRAAIDRGAITGSAADTRLAVQKAAETLGFVTPGQAASTQELMAGLGKITLAGVKTSGLGAGNGFTDKDREFLQSAISGTISDTPQNLRRVADLSERIAMATHKKGTAVLSRWASDPALSHVARDTVIDPINGESAGTQKTIVKTGMYGGKKVVQYSDGSTGYAN